MAAASLLLVVFVAVHGAAPALGFTRSDFPEDFVFGAATSAYQDDVKLIAETGLEAYRFSISWSRPIPNGRGAVNPKGLQYYNNLIDELLRHVAYERISSMNNYSVLQVCKSMLCFISWISLREDFTAYADLCFREFGDRVMYWTTLDEVNIAAVGILEPFVVGDYPLVMKKIVGSRLPSFTKVQSEAVRGALDFIGVNYYYSLYVNDRPLAKGVRDFTADMSLYYRGLATSNGSLSDTDRVDYMKKHIGSTLTTIRNGTNVKGYFAWSFLDVFELLSGFKSQYGLYRVDFNDDALPRQARLSARWYSEFLQNKEFRVEENEINDAGSHAQQ
ncbi:hypothetical protein PR202_gb04441 [Eleusine coracana subsp. coracana]|uniref:Beta-glucosidase n=1 Tax=Eleusine coracana subsp. coracana TaxID=191504 RepID=A0AAV5E5E4_ELECO|nr:hypothetical protein PR202_gb04441 [Eleusine coracana subsp. coracana]